jgi:hypothetical protein
MRPSLKQSSRQLWCCTGLACLALNVGCSSAGEEPALLGIPAECTVLEPGEPVVLAADARLIGYDEYGGRPLGSLTRSVLPADGDVYWYDYDGTVFVERQAEGQLVELARAEPPRGREYEEALGLAANADRVFVGYGHRLSGNDQPDLFAPGRLLAISKQSGQPEVLLELADQWLAPIVADAERVIVFAEGGGSTGFYQVPLATPRLEPLPLGRSSPEAMPSAEWGARELFSQGQLVGDEVYWASPASPSPRLQRASFDETEGEVVRLVPQHFSVGPGYLLTQEDVWLPGYYYVGKDFLLRDDSGCRAVRGTRGPAASPLALDAQFVYWVGRNFGPASGEVPLMRVDVASGALARLAPSGFPLTAYAELVGHDETRLFLRTGGALVSVQKP